MSERSRIQHAYARAPEVPEGGPREAGCAGLAEGGYVSAASTARDGPTRPPPLVPRLAATVLARLTASPTAARCVRFFDDQGGRVLAIIALNLVGALSFTATPFILRHLIDHGLAVPGTSALLPQVALLLVVFVFDAVTGAASRVIGSRLGETVTRRVTVTVHDHLLRLPFGFFPGQRQGELLSLFGNDVHEVRAAVSVSMPHAITAAVTAMVGTATVFVLEWRLSLLAVLLAPGVFALTTLGRRRGRELTRQHIKLRSAHFAQLADTSGVAGALHVRLFGRTDHESARFATVADDLERIAVRRTRVSAVAGLMSSAGAAVAVVAVMGFGGWLVSSGRTSIGTLIAFASALLYAYRPVTSLAESRSDLLEAGVGVERIFGLLDIPPDPRNLPTTTTTTTATGTTRATARAAASTTTSTTGQRADIAGQRAGTAVREPVPGQRCAPAATRAAPDLLIDRVWFRYRQGRQDAWSAAGRDPRRRWWYVGDPDEDPATLRGGRGDPAGDDTQRWNLRDLTLDVRSGEKTAVVGSSGAGKSTLGSLLAGIYQPDRGRILCGGVDLAVMDWEELRALVGVVPQDPYLFHDTIATNIRYGRLEASDEEVATAAVDAGLRPLLDKLPRGVETMVGARGYQLSGGERQRLALARVLLADPPVLVLDEATSQLDSLTENVVQEALSRLGTGRTRVVIAHRLSTIVDADAIHVLDAGTVVEQGTHGELLAAGGAYARLYARQVGQEQPASHQ
ncbi:MULTISPECIES: ABC transporter ATP-binding protein [unclassified Frankia]|uniref:ABC transporter ATP-binding protein n=1 Tax=unclassified Frankia TaxID=2632575 RepID=UPI002AD1E363|nr:MULTISPECIES: ABC transporter ATP-binding protein [unclassified Frankia]